VKIHFSTRFFSSREGRFFDDRINFSLPRTGATVRKEKEPGGLRAVFTVYGCNSQLSKKKAALRHFLSLDNIGNTIFTGSGMPGIRRGSPRATANGSKSINRSSARACAARAITREATRIENLASRFPLNSATRIRRDPRECE